MVRVILNYIFFGLLLQTFLVSAKLPDWVPAEVIDMAQGEKGRCMSEHGTTEDMINAVNEGNIPNDPKLTCYMFCLFESFSIIDEDGVLEYGMLTEMFPDDIKAKAETVLSGCAEQAGADNCEKVYKIATCVQSKSPDMWFMI
ncbi:general odorant-binding protein 69a [Microplitis demolitor]|uniref:general odorant-binding protein 69a n=1 Tax=Microplitis demolitor TaxID=69319 RepID=UPI0004CCEABB|nr:general odorant-binding protein 69a [Microplitis demolitor]